LEIIEQSDSIFEVVFVSHRSGEPPHLMKKNKNKKK